MTQLLTFRCDRCGKTYYAEHADWEVPTIELSILYGGAKRDEPDTKHLCDDCDATFSYFMENVKAFDALAEQIATEKEGVVAK